MNDWQLTQSARSWCSRNTSTTRQTYFLNAVRLYTGPRGLPKCPSARPVGSTSQRTRLRITVGSLQDCRRVAFAPPKEYTGTVDAAASAATMRFLYMHHLDDASFKMCRRSYYYSVLLAEAQSPTPQSFHVSSRLHI